MVLEVIRIVADRLAHASEGVNAVLAQATFPYDTGDAAPAAVSVNDETRDGWVARDEYPREKTGVLAVAQGEPVELDPNEWRTGIAYATASVAVLIRFAVQNAVTSDGMRDGMYVMRATAAVLAGLMNDSAAAARERNKVRITELTGLRLIPFGSPKLESGASDTVVIGALMATFTARMVVQ